MKKLFMILAAVSVAVTLSSCGSNGSNEVKPEEKKAPEVKVLGEKVVKVIDANFQRGNYDGDLAPYIKLAKKDCKITVVEIEGDSRKYAKCELTFELKKKFPIPENTDVDGVRLTLRQACSIIACDKNGAELSGYLAFRVKTDEEAVAIGKQIFKLLQGEVGDTLTLTLMMTDGSRYPLLSKKSVFESIAGIKAEWTPSLRIPKKEDEKDRW
jgi:predicted small lipoprotein YifL